jgi:hypothetical protein
LSFASSPVRLAMASCASSAGLARAFFFALMVAAVAADPFKFGSRCECTKHGLASGTEYDVLVVVAGAAAEGVVATVEWLTLGGGVFARSLCPGWLKYGVGGCCVPAESVLCV